MRAKGWSVIFTRKRFVPAGLFRALVSLCFNTFPAKVEVEVGDASRTAMDRPTVVCLCGSTRFYEQFVEANYRETMAGSIVLSVGFFLHRPDTQHGQVLGCSPEQKLALDEIHLRKIDLADEVLILNVDGYVGESTFRELKYAMAHGKRVRWLEPDKALL